MPPSSPSVADEIAKLEALGTAEHIRLHLNEAGVTGRAVRTRANACAVAVYLRDITGEDIYVALSHVRAGQAFDNPPLVTNPWVVMDFINRFDAGNYPELERAL